MNIGLVAHDAKRNYGELALHTEEYCVSITMRQRQLEDW